MKRPFQPIPIDQLLQELALERAAGLLESHGGDPGAARDCVLEFAESDQHHAAHWAQVFDLLISQGNA